MNWNKIKEKYPKFHNALMDWSEEKGDPILHDRCLYDFFDEQGIHIWIEREIDVDTSGYKGWQYVITQNVWSNDIDDITSSKTRTKAEEKAFEKAFEMLEKKL